MTGRGEGDGKGQGRSTVPADATMLIGGGDGQELDTSNLSDDHHDALNAGMSGQHSDINVRDEDDVRGLNAESLALRALLSRGDQNGEIGLNGVDEKGFQIAGWGKAMKKAQKEFAQIEEVKKRLESKREESKGKFKVCFRLKDQNTDDTIKSFADVGFLKCMRDIISTCARAVPRSRGDTLEVWVDSNEDVEALEKIKTLGGYDVVINENDSFLCRIRDVDAALTDDDIVDELKEDNVIWAKRETFRRKVQGADVVVKTTRVLLKFKGPPPPKIALLNQIHHVMIVTTAIQF